MGFVNEVVKPLAYLLPEHIVKENGTTIKTFFLFIRPCLGETDVRRSVP